MNIAIEPLNNMGAKVTGLDLTRDISASDRMTLRKAWGRYGVLVFPSDGEGSHERQLRLSHVFGEDEPHTLPELIVPEQQNLIYVVYDGDKQTSMYMVDEKPRLGWVFWHQDESYTTNIPMGSLLRMVQAADEGGDTGFIDIARAYADLPPALKRRIEGLNLIHRLGSGVPRPDAFGMRGINVRMLAADEFQGGKDAIPIGDAKRFPAIESPLVVVHPYTGEKTMLLSPLGLIGVAGLPKAEGDALLHEICDRVIQDKYKYVHHWADDDMVLWDNWAAMHMAMGYAPGQKRFGYRTTIKGPTDFRTGRVYDSAA